MTEQKVAVVTGASRGIGKAIAMELARTGALVIVNYNGSREKAEEVKAQIEAEGNQAEIRQCNVADFKSCEDMFQEIISAHGRVDILVNNAGITRDGLLMKMSEEDFDAVVDTNLKGAFNCILCRRGVWKCGTGELCGIQGRHYRAYKGMCKRACFPSYHGQCHRAGIY